jgi:flagellar basal body-associated protein FliL
MSDHAEKKEEAKPAEGGDGHGEAKKNGGIGALLTKLPVLLGGAMTLEAVVMLVAFKLLAGGPKAADASVDLADHGEKTESKEGAAKEEGAHDAPAKEGHDAPAKEEGGHGAPAKEEAGHGAAKEEGGHGGGGAKEPEAAPVDPKRQYEIPVVEFRAPNKIGGKTFLYDVSIYAVVRGKNKTQVESSFKDRGALIKDRVRTIIAQSDPDKLGGGAEPGLETLRRQVRYQLEQIVGDGLIDEILVPRCIPFRTDF